MGLEDRPSAPAPVPGRTPADREELIVSLRELRFTSPEIAETLGMPLSTVGAVLARHGLGKLPRPQPEEPANSYERPRPGELVHIDVKTLGNIGRPGHRVNGDRTDSQPRDRLGVRPRRRRRRDQACLRRGTRRREGTDRGRLPAQSSPLLPPLGDPGRAGADRQRLLLPGARARTRRKTLGIRHLRTQPYRPRRTARQSASSAPPPTAGPTAPSPHKHRADRRPRRLARLVQPTQTTPLTRPHTTTHPARRDEQELAAHVATG